MTINAEDVRALSSSPGPGGVPLPATEVDRIAAVLNRNTPARLRPSRPVPLTVRSRHRAP